MKRQLQKLEQSCIRQTNTYFDIFDNLLLTEVKEKLKSIKMKKELKQAKS